MGEWLQAKRWVFPAYLLAALFLTPPLATHFFSAIPSTNGLFDPGLQAFLLGWDWHALARDPLHVFNAPIFHPEARTLTYMDHLLGESVAAAPVYVATGSVAAGYNFLIVVACASSAWAMYRLVRVFGVPRLGAFLCGLLFAFSPYRLANLELLNQLQMQWLPLGLFFAFRFLEKRRVRDAVGVAAAVVTQVYFGWYYAFYLTLALGLLFAYAITTGTMNGARLDARRLGFVAVVAILAVIPVTLPYFLQHIEMPEFKRTLGEAALYSADVLDYFRWHPSAVMTGLLHVPSGSQSYWPGLVTVILGSIGASELIGRLRADSQGSSAPSQRRMLRRIRLRAQALGMEGYFLLLALSAFILSLGPILQIAGRQTWIPLPYAITYYVIPGLSGMRAPSRLAVVVLLALTVLAGLGYRRAQAAIAPQNRVAWRFLASILFGTTVLCAVPMPTPVLQLPTAETMPEVYKWLAHQPETRPILEVPVPARDQDENSTHAIRQYVALFHGKRRLDGVSGFVSERYRHFRAAMQGFPDSTALDAAVRMGARLIVVHYDDYSVPVADRLRSQIATEPALVPLATFGGDTVFKLDPGYNEGSGPEREHIAD
ncbi:MAG TPA: hypothetical protein VLL94_08925 [Nitrospiraceae bacterium]|nr:hypothetical protein [Nitrospiraceae bacterium]